MDRVTQAEGRPADMRRLAATPTICRHGCSRQENLPNGSCRLTRPRMHVYLHALIHTCIHMVCKRSPSMVVWPSISTNFHSQVLKASRIIHQAFTKLSPICIFVSNGKQKKNKYLLDVLKQLFRGTSSRRRKADLEKSPYPEEITSAAVAHDGGNQSWEVLGTELEKLCEAMNIVQAQRNLIEI